MRFFGFDITLSKAQPPAALTSVGSRGSWWGQITESFSGAWQKNVSIDRTWAQSHHAVFSCRTLIASDCAKLRIRLMRVTDDGVWVETSNPAFSPVLRKPNHFQNRMQFVESWIHSKLSTGNTYVLKRKDLRGVVVAMYVLDPGRVKPLVSPDGSVFYELQVDNIAGLGETITVPAREMIHDRYNTIFHPLVGVSPMYACGLAATQGLNIQINSATFFGNQSQPGGVLTAPGEISTDTADRLSASWAANFSGKNAGRVAVLGDGLHYARMSLTAEEAQLIEQSKWTSEIVCSVHHVPPYKIAIGSMPNFTNIQSLNIEYYSQCLQVLLEAMEMCLDEGLGLGEKLGTEFDVDNLLRMDSVTQMEVLDKGKNVMTPNEARFKINLSPVAGGNTVLRQQQEFSLEALAKRDAQEDPFASSGAKIFVPVSTSAAEPVKSRKRLSLSNVRKLFTVKEAA